MSTDEAKTILLVDDDPDFLLQAQIELQAAGYQVRAAESRREAERLLEDWRPDAAVVDLMMEDVDSGFTLCYHIKKKDASIPVILVTGVTSETGMQFGTETAEERAWVKADALLDKPVRFEQLKSELARLLET